MLHGTRDRPDLLRRGEDLLAPAADRGRGYRSREELFLHRLDHRSPAARSRRAPGRRESGPDALPRGRAAQLAGALLHASTASLTAMRPLPRCARLAAILATLIAATASAVPPGFVIEPVGSGWNEAVGMAFAADGRMFVWERGGRI